MGEVEVLNEYRLQMLSAEQKAQEDFDKTVVSLSGGALGVSFAFVKDFLGERPPTCLWLLELAWLAWGLSVTSILASYFTSRFALRRAIEQVDDRSILHRPAGGKFTAWTHVLNACGGFLFVVGVAAIGVFVFKNLGRVP